jgi:hypothetical protein
MRHLMLVAVLFCASSFAVEDISADVTAFLVLHSTAQADTQWQRTMLKKLKDKMDREDFISDLEAAGNIVVFDFFADHQACFGDGQRKPLKLDEKIEICRMHQLWVAQGWRWPTKIASAITHENFKDVIVGPVAETKK